MIIKIEIGYPRRQVIGTINKIIMEAKRILFTEDDVAKLKGRWMEVCPPTVAERYWEVMDQRYREG